MDPKVYSPDIKPFSMEGKSGIIGLVTSLIVGPIRVTSRVMHNIGILPANLMQEYSKGLFVCCGFMSTVGILELIFAHKWPLIVSQIPVAYLAYRLKYISERSVTLSQEKREVSIDEEKVESLVNEIYSEIKEELNK